MPYGYHAVGSQLRLTAMTGKGSPQARKEQGRENGTRKERKGEDGTGKEGKNEGVMNGFGAAQGARAQPAGAQATTRRRSPLGRPRIVRLGARGYGLRDGPRVAPPAAE